MARQRHKYLDNLAIVSLLDDNDDRLAPLFVDEELADDEADTVSQIEEVIVLQVKTFSPCKVGA